MGLEAAVGNFFFRSKFSNWLWSTSTGSPFYFVRLVGAVIISTILVVRCYRLFLYTRLTSAPILGFIVIGTLWSGPLRTAAAGLIVGSGYLFWQQYRQPTHNAGHRAGGKGFQDPLPENSVEALRNLIARDKQHPVQDFHYVEFDVHETKDGSLAVLHDLGSVLAASKAAAVNQAIVQELQEDAGADLERLKVQDVTMSQLKKLHVGGQKGIHIPFLEEFLRCCEQEGLRHSVAVEVKSILTDAGRSKFIKLLREYKEGYGAELEKSCPQQKYVPFGWIAAISFPFLWAPSFGEFCSPTWKHWAATFREAGVPVRSCVLHSLDLVPSSRGTR